MSNTNPILKHAVHEGVDPQSWLGFEQRIEQRRFVALLDVIRASLHGGDLAAAHAALSEARLLRPDAPELVELEAQALAMSSPARDIRFWTRMAGGLMLVVIGVSMLFGLEFLRRVQHEVLDVAKAEIARTENVRNQIAARIADTSPVDSAPAPRAEAPPPISATSTRIPAATPLPAPVLASSSGRSIPAAAESAQKMPPAVQTARGEISRTSAADMRAARERVNTSASRDRVEAPPTRGVTDVTAPAMAASVATPAPATPQPQPIEPLDRREPVPPPAAPPRAVASDTTATPPARPPAPAVSAPIAPTPANNRLPNDETRVADVLQRYARAYGELNAKAARDVWPSVDERALARAFDSLVSQHVSLQNCEIDVHGETADASCRGEARYVGKIGSGEVRTEPRAWRFLLRREGDEWKIETAQAQRASASSH